MRDLTQDEETMLARAGHDDVRQAVTVDVTRGDAFRVRAELVHRQV